MKDITQEERKIYALFDNDTIRVYQAYNTEIAEEALRLGTFGPHFSLTRMTWIKPSFLWMMYRCGWAEKENQEIGKRFCVIVNSEDFMIKTEKLDKSNIKELNIQIEVPENIVFLQDSTKKERKNAKNIFLEYLPIEKKIKLKKLLEDGEKIFSDYSVNEIL